MTLTRKQTYAIDGKARLLEQFKGLPNIEGLIESVANRAQDADDAIWQIYLMTMETAVGSQLDDVYGNIAGVDRLGLSDEEYRSRIRAQFRINRSSGTFADLLEMLRLVVAPGVTLRINEHFPATFEIFAEGEAIPNPEEFATFMLEAKAACVRGIFVSSRAGTDYVLRYENWNLTNTPITTNSLYAAVYGGGKFLVAGDSNKLLVSEDNGATWVIRTPSITQNARGAAWDGTSYVICGGATGNVGVSTDAITWSNYSSGLAGYHNSVAYGAGLFVFVGVGPDIRTSPDGASPYTVRTPPGANDLNDVVWGAAHSLFVAVGKGGDIATSPMGAIWTSRASGVVTELRQVGYDGTAFIAVGAANVMLRSTDGSTWAAVTGKPTGVTFESIIWGNNTWYVFEQFGSKGIWSSPDGLIWRQSPADILAGAPGGAFSAAFGNKTFVVGTFQEYIYTTPAVQQWNRGRWARAIDSAVTVDRSWEEVENPKNINLRDVAHDGVNHWVAVGGPDGADAYIITSYGSFIWEEQANPKNIGLRSVAFGDGYCVAVGDADGGDGYLLVSDDYGETWTEIANPKNFDLYGVAYGNGIWVAVGEKDGTDAYMITATDPTGTWTERANPLNVDLNDVAYDSVNGLWCAVGDDDASDAYLITATDPTGTWTQVSNGFTVDLESIAHDQVGTWVAVGQVTGGIQALILRSSDGVTWTQQTNPNAVNLRSVAHNGSRLWQAVGSAGGTDAYALTSVDGIVWTKKENPKNFDLQGVAHDGGEIWVAVGLADGTDAYLLKSRFV